MYFQTIKRRRDGFDDCRLCDYVYDEAQDEHYSYEITSIEPNDGCTTYFLTLHSQKWMDGELNKKQIRPNIK